MAQAGGGGQIRQQEIAAPDRTVGTVAGAVHDDRQDRVGNPVLGHHRHRMGVMMLDAVQGEVQFFGVAAAEIVGVEVAGDDLRRYLEDLAQMPDRFGVEGQRFEVEQITDMLAENDGAIPSQAEGAFSRRRSRGSAAAATARSGGRGHSLAPGEAGGSCRR